MTGKNNPWGEYLRVNSLYFNWECISNRAFQKDYLKDAINMQDVNEHDGQ